MNSELSRIDINGVNYYLLDEATKAEVLSLQQKVPAEATPSNKLADKAFVSSTIGDKLEKITQEQFNEIFT